MLQLVYLGTTSEIVRYEPDEADLLATERKVDALWEAIELRQGDRRVPAQPWQAVRLVRVQGALPGLGRRAAADAEAAVALGPAQAALVTSPLAAEVSRAVARAAGDACG